MCMVYMVYMTYDDILCMMMNWILAIHDVDMSMKHTWSV